MNKAQSNTAIAYAQAIAVLSFAYATIRTASYTRGLTDTSYNFHIFDSVLYSFTIPLLFFIVGATYTTLKHKYNNETLASFIIDKLFYTFLLWTIIQGLLEVIFSGYTNSSVFVIDIYYSIIDEPDSHFKLLIALIINIIAASILLKKTSPIKLLFLLTLSTFAFFMQGSLTELYPFKYIANYFVYFLLGYTFTLYVRNITAFLGIIFYISAPIFLMSQYIIHISYQQDTFGLRLFNLPVAIIGIAFIIGLCYKIKENNFKVLIAIRNASFVIFLTHAIFGNGTREILFNSLSIKNTILHIFVDYITAIAFALIAYNITKNNFLRCLFTAPEKLSIKKIYPIIKNKIKQKSLFVLLPIFFVVAIIISIFIINMWSKTILENKKTPTSIKHFELSNDLSDIKEGRRLAQIFGCYFGCHGINMEGRVFSKEPFVGVFVSPNLTKSIDKYSTGELDGIIRHGVKPDGLPLVGRMPSVSFNAINDEQLMQILSFIKSAPKQYKTTVHSSLGTKTQVDIIQGKLLTQPDKIILARSFYPTQNNLHLTRGQALVRAACSECHNYTLKGLEEAQSPPLSVARAYQFEQLKTLLKTGIKLNGEDAGLMGIAARNRFSKLNAGELSDIYTFLQTLEL